MKRYLYGAAFAAVLAIGAGLYGRATDAVAPESTFVLLDGSKTTTASLRGKVTLVNFWATSCVICVAEMPKLVSTYDRYHSRGFETVAVAMAYDPPALVVNYAETRRLPFKVAIDNTGTVAKAWGEVELTPTSILVDRHGRVIKRYVGEPDFNELSRLIETLLNQA